MKRFSLRLGTALLTFALSVTLSWVVSNVFKTHQTKVSTNIPIEDRWHRLYEAAAMTGDSTASTQVFRRLQCTNRQGIADAVYTQTSEGEFCQRADMTKHEIDLKEYGAFEKHIRESHHAWTLANLDFIRSLSSKSKAQNYLSSVEGIGITVTINETRLVSDSLTTK